MSTETELLLQQCRDALVQQRQEHLAELLCQWFEGAIGEEAWEEALDDLCLLLGYRVQSLDAHHSYATYTSWWEVEGTLQPSAGTFFCTDVERLGQRLLDLPLEQFGLVVELAERARSREAEQAGEPHLPTGPAGLRELAAWLAGPLSTFRARRSLRPHATPQMESPEERRQREQAWAAQVCAQGYLVRSPDMPQAVIDAFRRWCQEHAHPYFWVEPQGRAQATLRVQAKKAGGWREADALLARFREDLPGVCHPYLARAQAQGFQARLTWFSQRHVALEGLLAEDAEAAAREVVARWSALLAEERKLADAREAERRAALEPPWQRELKHWREQGPPADLPVLAAEVVLPSEWEALFGREQLSAFLAFLGSPARSREPKAILVQRVEELLATDRAARAQVFELFKRELAVPPWELETLLACTPTERKRWTDEGLLPVLEHRGFRKGGKALAYPVFDRRVILGLARTELERWRAEHQKLVKTHRRASAQVAATRRKIVPEARNRGPESLAEKD